MTTTPGLSTRPVLLGKSGIPISPIAWGMWRLEGDAAARAGDCIRAAIDAGITLFDTADIYGAGSDAGFGSSEDVFGAALAREGALRDRMVIATKGGIRPGVPYDSGAAYLADAIDASLRRLRIDTIDLYQIHRRDFLTHPHEVADALARAIDTGKVRAVGVSNHSVAEADALQAFLPVRLASTQPEFSAVASAPLFDGVLDHAMRHGHAVLAWSPLGGGRLTDAAHPAGALLAAHGAAHGVDAGVAALSWVMAHPARIVPIVGSQNPARIAAAAGATNVGWTRAQWYAVLEAGMGAKLP